MPSVYAQVVTPASPSDNLVLESPAVVQAMPQAMVEAWTMQALEQRAMEFHPLLGESWARIQAAQGNYIQVGLQNNPNVGYSGQQLGSGGLAEQHGIMFGKDIIRSEKLELSRRAAAGEVHRLEHEYEVARIRIRTDVQVAFVNALAARKQIDLAKNLVEVAQRGVGTVEQLRKGNEASKGDVLQSKIEVYDAENELVQAENRWRAAWQSLATLTALPTDCPQEIRGEIDPPAERLEYCDFLSMLRSTSPELAVAAAEIERTRQVVARARVEPLPNVNFQGLINVVDNGIAGKPDGAVQVSIPIPTKNRNQGAIQKAIQDLRAAEQAYARLELALQSRLTDSLERYNNAKALEERYREKILPESKESLSLIQIAYREGETNLSSLLLAQRTFSKLSLSQLEATRQRRVLEAEMEGMLLSGSLTAK